MKDNSIENWIFIIAVVIIIIFLIILLLTAGRVAGANDIPIITEDLDPYTLKTGDILGVGYKHPFGWFVSGWTGSVWSHCGIVWIDPTNSEIFVLEAAIYEKPYKGVFKIPLSTWIRINKNHYLGLSRIKGKPVDPVALINAFEERKKYVELDSYNWRWYRLLYKQPYFEETRTKYTCYELVVSVLQDTGVMTKEYACSSYFPTNIMEGEIQLTEGYYLDPPITINVSQYNQLRELEENKNKKGKGCLGSVSGTC